VSCLFPKSNGGGNPKATLLNYEIRYMKCEEKEPELDPGQVQYEQWASVTGKIPKNKRDTTVVVKKLLLNSRYKFVIRCENGFGWGPFGEVVQMSTAKERPPLLWDKTKHGTGITFVSDLRVKYSSYRAMAIADYVIKDTTDDVFCWEIEIHQYSNHSWFGFVQYPVNYNLNNYVGENSSSWGCHCCSGSRSTAGRTSGSEMVTLTELIGVWKVGDKMGFRVDMKAKTCEVFHNGKSIGVAFKGIRSAIVPAASNNVSVAEYSIRRVDGF